MSEEINIYPPLLASSLPAFNKNVDIHKIYLTLSSFNVEQDFNFNYSQIRVDYQNSNMSALNLANFITGIKFTDIKKESDGRLYIEISNNDLKEGGFEINQLYKVQIRLCSKDIPENKVIDKDYPTIAWQTENQKYYSEWSQPCIIKGIKPPVLKLNNFFKEGNAADYEIRTQTFSIAGTFEFEKGEAEYIKSYQILLYEQISKDNHLFLHKTNTIYTAYNNPNEINYTVQYKLQSNIKYLMVIMYETNNMYIGQDFKEFTYAFGGLAAPRATIAAETEIETGRIKILITPHEGTSIYNGFTICRSSSLNNFTVWEDMHNITLLNPVDEYVWYDNTVQHGIWYKYSLQRQTSAGVRGAFVEIENPILAQFEDTFLTTGDRQLNIKLNPQISSFSRKIAESITETIGSKYPFVRRNGSMEYQTFNISGLIAAYCDEENLFTDKDEIYGQYKSWYYEHNEMNNIKDYNNVLYEKEFRNKVMDFLYDNTVKLFRSPTEGNILVKLSNISFTPETALGRMLYSFSATAYEIDNVSIDNYIKYNIILLESISNEEVKSTYAKVGQLYNETFAKDADIVSMILEKEKTSYISDEFVLDIDKIEWVRIEFNSNSYLINDSNNVDTPVIISDNYQQQKDDNIIAGYLVTVNDNLYIVQDTMGIHTLINNEDYLHSGSFFELTEENDSAINSLSFPVDTVATIDYYVTFKEHRAEGIQAINDKQIVTYYIVAGQEARSFKPMISLKNTLQEKYFLQLQNTTYSLVAVEKVLIEAAIGTIVQIKTINDNKIIRYVIDNTNMLVYGDGLNTIEELYFGGLHFESATSNWPREGEFFEINTKYSSFDEISPKERYAYTVNNIRYLYLNSKWYVLSDMNDIACDVDAVVDYYCRVQKGE